MRERGLTLHQNPVLIHGFYQPCLSSIEIAGAERSDLPLLGRFHYLYILRPDFHSVEDFHLEKPEYPTVGVLPFLDPDRGSKGVTPRYLRHKLGKAKGTMKIGSWEVSKS